MWLRHHSSQTLYVTRVKASLRDQGMKLYVTSLQDQALTQQEEVVMTSRPVGQEGHRFLVVWSILRVFSSIVVNIVLSVHLYN